MKNYIASTIAVTGLIIFVFGMESAAQTVTRITAEVPFDFYVGNELLPKGRYEFEPATRQTLSSSLIVRPVMKSARRSMIVPVIVSHARPSDGDISLRFSRYGSVHYLSGIHADVDGLSMKLLPTSTEKQLAKRYEVGQPVTIRPASMARN